MDTASDKALQRFAELMIEKIKQVEDNWQKPWFGIKGGGLPQNIEGRTYNGVNSFMLFLLSEKEQYSLPVYMTFMQAKDSGLNILKGEKSFPVIYWNFSVRDKNGKKIPFDVYKNLDKKRAAGIQGHAIFEDIQCIQRTADQSSGNETGEMGSIEGAIQNTSHQG